jgi:hypothetical protein
MAQEKSDNQMQAAAAAVVRGSSARARFDVADDVTAIVIRNPGADGSPARANTQTRTYTVNS